MFILIKSSMLNMLEDDNLLVFCAIFHYSVILWHMMPPVLLFCSILSICLTTFMAIYCTYVSFIMYLMVSYISAFSGHYHFKSKTLQDEFSPEGRCQAAMFALFVKEELDSRPEQSRRVRSWVTIPEAIECCRHAWMQKHWKTGSTNGAMMV